MTVDYDDCRVQSCLYLLWFVYSVTEGCVSKGWAWLTGSLSGVKLHLATRKRTFFCKYWGAGQHTGVAKRKNRETWNGRGGENPRQWYPPKPALAVGWQWRGTETFLGWEFQEQTGTQQWGQAGAAEPSRVPCTGSDPWGVSHGALGKGLCVFQKKHWFDSLCGEKYRKQGSIFSQCRGKIFIGLIVSSSKALASTAESSHENMEEFYGWCVLWRKTLQFLGKHLSPSARSWAMLPVRSTPQLSSPSAGKSPECPWVSGTHGMHGLMLCFGWGIHCAHPEVWAVQYLCTQVSVRVTWGGAQPAEGRQTHRCLQEVQLLGL